jgi:hypothetical protein
MRVELRDNDAPEPLVDNFLGAGRIVLSGRMEGARFEATVQGRPTNARARPGERERFGVRPAVAFMKSLADRVFPAHDYRADHGIRTHLMGSRASELETALEKSVVTV